MTPEEVVTAEAIERAGPDPLGILATCAVVVNDALQVEIAPVAIARLARDTVDRRIPPPVWNDDVHYRGEGREATERTIGWIFALDALNFCFWGQGADPQDRWRIRSGDGLHDGYMALAIALRDAARAGTPIWDPAWQARVDDATLASLFQPAPGSAPIPLLPARVAHLRELGQHIASGGSDRPYTAFVDRAAASAPILARTIVDALPSFRDVARWTPTSGQEPAIEVRLYKRAQILVSDLSGVFAKGGELVLQDHDQLTAFADYKVPQVLRHLGILRYGDDLATRIHQRQSIPAGSSDEVEIRAASIWACELIRQHLTERGSPFTAAEVDWLLWNLGQALPPECEPYHRTVTIFY